MTFNCGMGVGVALVADVVNVYVCCAVILSDYLKLFVEQTHLGINVLTCCEVLNGIRKLVSSDCKESLKSFLLHLLEV